MVSSIHNYCIIYQGWLEKKRVSLETRFLIALRCHTHSEVKQKSTWKATFPTGLVATLIDEIARDKWRAFPTALTEAALLLYNIFFWVWRARINTEHRPLLQFFRHQKGLLSVWFFLNNVWHKFKIFVRKNNKTKIKKTRTNNFTLQYNILKLTHRWEASIGWSQSLILIKTFH